MLTFDIPQNYSRDVDVYYVDEAGQKTKLAGTIDPESRTITTELEHFSTYVPTDNRPNIRPIFRWPIR